MTPGAGPPPAAIVVNTIVLRGREVLLTEREDFEVWCLPGGHVDPGESVRAAAARETLEETGFEVELDELVGVYSAIGDWPSMHACVFTAHLLRDEPQALGTPDEVLDVAWFPVDALPDDLMWWHRRRIQDAAAGRRGLVEEQRIRSRLGLLDRVGLYRARDDSGVGRREFFGQTFPPPVDRL